MTAHSEENRPFEFPADIHQVAADIRRQALQHPERDPVVRGKPAPRTAAKRKPAKRKAAKRTAAKRSVARRKPAKRAGAVRKTARKKTARKRRK